MDIKNEAIAGLKWSTIGQVIKFFFQIVLSICLSRILIPYDVGAISIVLIWQGLCQIMINLNLSLSIVYRQDLNELEFSIIHWTGFFISIFISLFSFLISSLVNDFYNDPEIGLLISVNSLNMIFIALYNVPQALLNKKMDFSKLVFIEITSFVTGGMGALFFALKGLGAWSIVAQNFIYNGLYLLLIMYIIRWKPLFVFSIQPLKKLYSYSANMTGFDIIYFIFKNLDAFLIGKYIGIKELGIYSRGYSFGAALQIQLMEVFRKVMFPSLSKLNENLNEFKKLYFYSLKIIMLIVVPFMVLFFLEAHFFVEIILGSQWHAVTIILQLFCIYGIVQSAVVTTGWIFMATGKAALLFRLSLVLNIVQIAAILIGIIYKSYILVAVLYNLTAIFSLVFLGYHGLKIISTTLFAFFEEISDIILCFFCIGCFTYFIDHYFLLKIQYPTKALLILIIYLLLIFITIKLNFLKNYKILVQFLRKIINNKS
jgi:O-antigen/teichoic acid export membrane protein